MERRRCSPRRDYAQRVEALGLSFHARDGYWTEDVCYRLTAAEVDCLEAATEELQAMYVEAMGRVIAQGRLGELGIPPAFEANLIDSWRRQAPSLYGRFDLAFDGGTPRLLEYNADTPTSLLEAAVIQWSWHNEVFPGTDQFNSIHERLIAAWSAIPANATVPIACLMDQEEDWVTASYLLDTLIQSGRRGAVIELAQVGWDARRRVFIGPDDAPLEYLFKLYPWEWLMREEFGPHLVGASTQFIEPMYKVAMSSKGMLPLLWEYFPGHPNLLEAYRTPGKLRDFARKPLMSREGQNIELVRDGQVLSHNDGVYATEPSIYQALCLLPSFDGAHPVFGSWVIAGAAAGIGIRESSGLITNDQSRFVPHWF